MPHPPVPEDFEAFVCAHGRWLFRTAFLLCGDLGLAEDLAQTTLAKLYARWGAVARLERPAAYARVVLTNGYRSHVRLRRNREAPAPVEAVDGVVGAPQAERVDLLAALRGLESTDRAVVVLRYWEDLSVAETAGLLGLSEAAVRQRARRALARLRESPALTDLKE